MKNPFCYLHLKSRDLTVRVRNSRVPPFFHSILTSIHFKEQKFSTLHIYDLESKTVRPQKRKVHKIASFIIY